MEGAWRKGVTVAAIAGALDRAEDLSRSAAGLAAQLQALSAAADAGTPVAQLAEKLRHLCSVALDELGADEFNELKQCLALVAKALQEQRELSQNLQREVDNLRRKVDSLLQESEGTRQMILLGQVVYTLEDIVRREVLGPEYAPMSLQDIAETVNDFGSDASVKKWAKFVGYLERQDLNVQKLVKMSRPLRHQRYSVAHGTEEERARVSPDQLREWAGPNLQRMVDSFLCALEPLTCEGQPLVPRTDVSTVFA